MTSFERYRAVAALGKLEGLAHALRVDLSRGAEPPSMEILGEMEDAFDLLQAAVAAAPEEWTAPTSKESR